ncbi:hypothetical protein BTHI11S_00433 [Bosea thiooxidans]
MPAAAQNGVSAAGTRRAGPRCIAIVGPFQSGKTTLLESILMRCGALTRTGSVKGGNTVGDAAPEARAHQMSTEPSVAASRTGPEATWLPVSLAFAPARQFIYKHCAKMMSRRLRLCPPFRTL